MNVELTTFITADEDEGTVITLQGPSDWRTFPGPWTCVDCPAGFTREMHVSQMADHMKIFHTNRGDKYDEGWDSSIDIVIGPHDKKRG